MSATALKSRLGDRVNGFGLSGSLNGGLNNDAGARVRHTNLQTVSPAPQTLPQAPPTNNHIPNVSDDTDLGEVAVIETSVNSNYIALANTNAIDIINENLKGQPLSLGLFDIIKAPTGGMTAFSVPSLAGDEVQKELVGIILDYHTPRAYWSTSEPVEGTPPDCYSHDSQVSTDGRACATCVYNTFGSKGLNGNGTKEGDSNAKACKESVVLFLLRQDEIMPIMVRVPVTSKFIFQRYLARLVSKMIPLSGVATKITLEKATSNGGQSYAKFVFEAIHVLPHEEAAHARAYGQKFAEMLDVGANGAGSEIADVVYEVQLDNAHNPHVHNNQDHNQDPLNPHVEGGGHY